MGIDCYEQRLKWNGFGSCLCFKEILIQQEIIWTQCLVPSMFGWVVQIMNLETFRCHNGLELDCTRILPLINGFPGTQHFQQWHNSNKHPFPKNYYYISGFDTNYCEAGYPGNWNSIISQRVNYNHKAGQLMIN